MAVTSSGMQFLMCVNLLTHLNIELVTTLLSINNKCKGPQFCCMYAGLIEHFTHRFLFVQIYVRDNSVKTGS